MSMSFLGVGAGSLAGVSRTSGQSGPVGGAKGHGANAAEGPGDGPNAAEFAQLLGDAIQREGGGQKPEAVRSLVFGFLGMGGLGSDLVPEEGDMMQESSWLTQSGEENGSTETGYLTGPEPTDADLSLADWDLVGEGDSRDFLTRFAGLLANRRDSVLGGESEDVDGVLVGSAGGAEGGIASGATEEATDSSADPATMNIDRDLGRLDPELRSAVERVMDRLRDEFGIDAEVAEGYRSGERQEALFAQGRSAPGPKVTWTLNSQHGQGRAVDMVLNGQWNDLEPYRVLQRVAQEEGLSTLGMQDSGHLELAQEVPDEVDPVLKEEAKDEPPALQRRGGMARVARVARVASTARVARVGAASHEVRNSSATADGEMTVDAKVLENADRSGSKAHLGNGEARQGGRQDGASGEPGSRGTEAGGRTSIPVEPDALPEPPIEIAPVDLEVATSSRSEASSTEAPTETGVASVAFSDSGGQNRGLGETAEVRPGAPMARINQVQALRDLAEAQGPRMHVDLKDVDGLGTDIRVDLRGSKVGASIGTQDLNLGARMQQRVGELQTSLEAQGLEPDGLQIKTASEAEAALSLAKAAAGADASAHGDQDPRDLRERERDATRRHDETKDESKNDDREGQSNQRRQQ